jgi:hypothetical protein
MRGIDEILRKPDLEFNWRRTIKQYPTNDGNRRERAGIGSERVMADPPTGIAREVYPRTEI